MLDSLGFSAFAHLIVSFFVRRALESDAPAVQVLLDQLGYPDSFESILLRTQAYIKGNDTGLIVAEDSGTVVGFLAWSCQELFVRDAVRFHIEALVVKKELRGCSIGRALLTTVEMLASNRNRVVDLTSGAHRAATGAHAFYRHLGYLNEGDREKVYLRKDLPAQVSMTEENR